MDETLNDKPLVPDNTGEPKMGPGWVNIMASDGKGQASCIVKEFQDGEAMNQWFKENRGYVVIQMMPRRKTYAGGIQEDRLVCVIAREVTQENMDEIAEVQQEVTRILAERHAVRRKSELEAQEAAKKAEAERLELIQQGRKCREHHGQVIEDNVKLRKEVKTLRAKAGRQS